MYNDIDKLFKIKDISTNKYDINRDLEFDREIRYMDSPYFYIGLPCDYDVYSFYKQPKNISRMKWEEEIKPLKPNTPYMSFVVFKVVKYTPMSTSGGFISSVKAVPPSLIVQTMDGRTMEAYKYVKEQGRGKIEGYITLSDAVLAEVRKNFVHPRLTLYNFKEYSMRNNAYDGYVYTIGGIKDTEYVAPMYSRWKNHKHEVKRHLESIMAAREEEKIRIEEEARKIKEQKEKYKNDLESAFGGNSSSNTNFGVYYCPTCRTGCRVPARGKKIEVTCPKCGRKFTVFC